MSTATQTFTKIDIRKVCEMLSADLQMLAIRTQAMSSGYAHQCAHDVCLMAEEQCLNNVHIQLRDTNGQLVIVHRYSVKNGIIAVSKRPGGNRWPCLPDATLSVIIELSNRQELEKLKRQGSLKLEWSISSLSTNYSGMKSGATRLYSSNSFGMQRDTFVN